jgi:hypothetical protein
LIGITSLPLASTVVVVVDVLVEVVVLGAVVVVVEVVVDEVVVGCVVVVVVLGALVVVVEDDVGGGVVTVIEPLGPPVESTVYCSTVSLSGAATSFVAPASRSARTPPPSSSTWCFTVSEFLNRMVPPVSTVVMLGEGVPPEPRVIVTVDCASARVGKSTARRMTNNRAARRTTDD